MAFTSAQLEVAAQYAFREYMAVRHGVAISRPEALCRLTGGRKIKPVDEAAQARRDAMVGFGLMVATVLAFVLWVADLAGWLGG